MDDYYLDVRLGPHHFIAKGAADSVRQDYERFLQRVDRAPASAAPRSCGKPWPAIPSDLTKCYAAHDDGIISLKELPPKPIREARSLLLLLYGFLVIETQSSVTSTELRTAADRSGLAINRVDRVIARYVSKGFVNRAGVKRGASYSLTENGIRFTEDFLHKNSQEKQHIHEDRTSKTLGDPSVPSEPTTE